MNISKIAHKIKDKTIIENNFNFLFIDVLKRVQE